MEILKTKFKEGDKVNLADAGTFVLPACDMGKMTDKKATEHANMYKESIEAIKSGRNGYIVLEITSTSVHCRNDAIPKWMSDRNMFYGKNDLHLITKQKD